MNLPRTGSESSGQTMNRKFVVEGNQGTLYLTFAYGISKVNSTIVPSYMSLIGSREILRHRHWSCIQKS
jgi:hypothetical protein